LAVPGGELFFPGSPILTVAGTFAECVDPGRRSSSRCSTTTARSPRRPARMVDCRPGRPVIEMGLPPYPRRGRGGAARASLPPWRASPYTPPRGRAALRHPTTAPPRTPSRCCMTTKSAAFASQVAALGKDTTLLVDTYDITRASATRCAVAARSCGAIRLDSGDLSVLAAQSGCCSTRSAPPRRDRGLRRPRRVLDRRLAPSRLDSYGAGTAVSAGSGAPTRGLVYKLSSGWPPWSSAANTRPRWAAARPRSGGTSRRARRPREIVVSQGVPDWAAR